jgi:hypothetical protein
VAVPASTFAQPVIGSLESITAPETQALKPNATNRRNLPSLSSIKSILSGQAPFAQWGPVAVRPHILHRFSYGDGLLNPTQQERQSSVINTTTAGVRLAVGKHWSVSYAATNNEYSNRFITDSLDHDASVVGNVVQGDWTFGVTQSYRTNSPILAETGQQTGQEFYSTGGNAAYQLGSRSLLEFSIARTARLANSDVDTPQWTTADWYSWVGSGRFRYGFSPKFEAVAGIEMSYDEISRSPDMQSMQPHLQLTWRPTDKLSLSARAGSEMREVEGDEVGDINNPVYSASFQYDPFDTTTISLSASQGVSASFFANLASKSRTYGASLSQRLLQRFYLSMGYSVGETSYITTSLNFIDGRRDDFSSYNVRVSMPVLRRGSVAIFAQRTHNSSNTSEFDFTSDQFGLEVGYSF